MSAFVTENQSHPPLPSFVWPLLERIQRELGETIDFQECADLEGSMAADFDGLVVWYRPGDWTDSGVAEELLHLRLRLDGYPTIRGNPTGSGGRAATLLSNVLDHRLIYPELETAGYCPWKAERVASLKRLKAFWSGNLSTHPDWRAEWCMELARLTLASYALALPSRVEGDAAFLPATIPPDTVAIVARLSSVVPGTSTDEACRVLHDSLETLRMGGGFSIERNFASSVSGTRCWVTWGLA